MISIGSRMETKKTWRFDHELWDSLSPGIPRKCVAVDDRLEMKAHEYRDLGTSGSGKLKVSSMDKELGVGESEPLKPNIFPRPY